MGWLSEAFDKHKLMRRSIVIWAMALITFVVIVVFTHIEGITGTVVQAMTIVIGILATAIGFYQWLRNKDDEVSKMTCPFCGYEHENVGDRYGCPNCNGEGLDGEE